MTCIKNLPNIEEPLKNNATSIVLGSSKIWLDEIHLGAWWWRMSQSLFYCKKTSTYALSFRFAKTHLHFFIKNLRLGGISATTPIPWHL